MKVIYDSRKDIRLIATGSASPVLEKGSADSGTGRWNVSKISTMSFYEYCRLLELEEPKIPENFRLSGLVKRIKLSLVM
ncbi:MAG: AAA family ATPase [Roseburia sp.]|nr:AAA family ATPase [Roseburia sp.]